MALVYIVEDDKTLRAGLGHLLELEGLEWCACEDFADVATAVLAAQPDCVVLDAMLPGTDGRVICRQLRAQSDVPIIMLTCLDSEFDEVMAFNQGADDYLVKPYRPAVLLAHIRAALRRKDAGVCTVVEHNGVALDLGTGQVTYQGRETELTRNEARILGLLIRNAGAVTSRAELMCDLWESDAFIDDNTLTVNVNRLRRALASIGVPEGFVSTKRGAGYLV